MSLASNAACSVCHNSAAKWLCRCANEAICQEGSCLQTHMGKSGRAHTLVDYQLGIEMPKQEAESHMKGVDSALEVIEFVRAEEEWLVKERNRLAAEIDRGIEYHVNQVWSYGERKKQELNRLLEETIKSLEVFKTAEKCQFVLGVKQQSQHLKALTFEFPALQVYKPVELQEGNQAEIQRFERRYQLALCPTSRNFNWVFRGETDAISFKTSAKIELIGVSLCKGETEKGLALQSLEILKGYTTKSQVLYSDTETRYMDSYHPYKVDVGLKKCVPIAPNTWYTVKVKMLGCRGKGSDKMLCTNQDGLVITPLNTHFNKTEADNGSNVAGGIFYQLLYLICTIDKSY